MVFSPLEATQASQLQHAWPLLVPHLPTIGALLAFSVYYPLYKRTRAGTTPMNIATFVLWALLDLVIAASTFFEGGNWLLPLLYVVGAGAMIHAIRRSGVWQWQCKEWMASAFVVACIAVWYVTSGQLAIVMSTLGSLAAGVPLLADNWKDPRNAPIDLYLGFLIGNSLSLATFAAGAPFTIEEHFYGAAGTLLTVSFIVAASRRWLPKFRSQSAT